MDIIFLYLIIINIFLYTVVHGQTDCPEHEEQNLHAVKCQKSCANIYLKEACPDQTLVERCTCKTNYVRNNSNKCILPTQCTALEIRCPRNTEYTECGAACAASCTGVKPPLCPHLCSPGCICKGDKVLDESSKTCVKKSDCPKQSCGPNAEYRVDTVCPKTCDNRYLKLDCGSRKVAGCFCKKHYLYDSKQRKCVLESQCTLVCPANELVDPCASPCQPTCLSPRPLFCRGTVCTKACVCKPPLVRNRATGECICVGSCPKLCTDPNEEYQKCGTACPLTCENRFILLLCTDNCVAGCFCKPGFVRDKSNKCIPVGFCDCVTCPENQVFQEKGFDCKTCANFHIRKPCVQSNDAKCYCKEGYVRGCNENCVKPENCIKTDFFD